MPTAAQPRTCRRCHGSGHEPARPTYNADQEAVLEELVELSALRSATPSRERYTASGRAQLDRVYAGIREAIEDGEVLGVRKIDMQVALGVSSAAFYKIKNRQTGGGEG